MQNGKHSQEAEEVKENPRKLGLHTIDRTYNEPIEETVAKIHDGSLRSGNRIEYEGTLVIIGDINAGAEVIAGEHIIVLGTIRGLAHAGAQGNRKAMIIANSIEAPQLRIADIVKEIEKTETYEEEQEEEIKTRAYVVEKEIKLE